MDIGSVLPIWSIIPFAGMLLSIAIFPLVKGEWWEAHELHVAMFWSLVFLIPFTAVFGFGVTVESLAETVLGDYVPFIVLLLGLFTVAGGIHVKGTIVGTTKNNVVLLALGTFIASWVGTTGAAMLLIRPVLRANLWRKHKAHIVVFFIFLVANMGGCLTPLGDPPLFLGYLRGVPFFWTLEHIWPMLVFNTVIMLIVFALIDRHYIKKEGKEGAEALALEDAADERTPIRIEGWHNLFFLAVIIIAVILNGSIPQMEAFIDPATGATYGFDVEGVHIGVDYIVQIVLILIAMALSLKTTPKELREDNNFEWGPIAEVAKLFIGIFITMIPALMLLRTNGASLGIDSPLKFFWATGALSSFLDNSPTYVVFMTTAGALGSTAANALSTAVGIVDPKMLLAISAGAVFMGANTYIGNAPNFMVKNIAESANVKMPSFFAYMGWSGAILIPLFAIDSLVFFL
ncbi:sodium:proton antiporter [Curtanaerobium respiraculi]|uniref:sodium:proton antiporter n=1 Tax=Curtanaerobium respiraculi TaxID=2949669 RepID=UPI0024B34D7A|nr:sodium:proton antiporter [Curtanaerobium respiraculi]